jgi:uncharacterized protein (DUF924 family)
MTSTRDVAPQDVLAFWRGAGPEKWFKKDEAFDAEVAARFLAAYEHAVRGELSAWETTPDGALALAILLDQLPRNMFRGQARTYAADALARDIAGRALARGFDREVPHQDRRFFYLPFMHSESLADQERCVTLAKDFGDAEFSKYAEHHADIVRRFGRFPHRNAMLKRETTPEEQEFLDDGGFTG